MQQYGGYPKNQWHEKGICGDNVKIKKLQRRFCFERRNQQTDTGFDVTDVQYSTGEWMYRVGGLMVVLGTPPRER